MAKLFKGSKIVAFLLIAMLLMQCAVFAADEATVYFSIAVDGELKVAAQPVTVSDLTVEAVIKAAHAAYYDGGEAGFAAGTDATYNMYMINTCWGIATTPYVILNGAPLATAENASAMTADTAAVKDGDNVIIAINTDYMNPYPVASMTAEVSGDEATVTVTEWTLDFMTFSYAGSPLANYKVVDASGAQLGTTDADGKITVKTASGVVCADGVAAICLGEAEAADETDGEGVDVITAPTSDEEQPADIVIAPAPDGDEETAPVVVRSNQTITVDGEAVQFDVYNIDGNNYFKLRDIAMKLSGTDSTFAVGYDNTTRTITCTTGEAYEPNGSELVIGDDLSATAVRSNQPLYINGELSTIKAFNIGGNNFFQLRELGEALGFGVDYDNATRTVIINTAKEAEEEAPAAASYKLSVKVATAAGIYEIPGENDFTDWETTSDTSFVSGPMGYNNNYGFTYYVSNDAFPTEHSNSTWSVITIGKDYPGDVLDLHLELDEGSDTNKHAVVNIVDGYAGTEEQVVYLALRAKSGNPFYFYIVTVTPVDAAE